MVIHRRPLMLVGASVLLATVACGRSTPAPPSDQAAVLDDLRARITARKDAASRGDSTAWLAAAELLPQAVCVDAFASRRPCRPDFGAPAQWQQRIALDSVELALTGDVAVVTYREVDTVLVAGNVATGQAR